MKYVFSPRRLHPQNAPMGGKAIISVLHMKKLRHMEVKLVTQGCSAGKHVLPQAMLGIPSSAAECLRHQELTCGGWSPLGTGPSKAIQAVSLAAPLCTEQRALIFEQSALLRSLEGTFPPCHFIPTFDQTLSAVGCSLLTASLLTCFSDPRFI